ncbi:MAG: DUF305 domain-containing protein [Smithellaceae bacterium]|nr:DUF305 domain-containing protein [Smithellaceae bacterium]
MPGFFNATTEGEKEMETRTKAIIVTIAALAVIAGIGFYVLNQGKNDMAGRGDMGHSNSEEARNESTLYKQYAALKGEDYDRTFIAGMIEHHRGAVDMANLAMTNAGHQELKDMAKDIVAAQTKEINEMKSWQTSFGHQGSGDKPMDHSATGMMSDMAAMTEKLKGKTGDEFDKLFLSLMIEHHGSAIDMAKPGETNAKRPEVKTLTKAIIGAQSQEIAQMKQWQKDWGYESR